MKNLARRLIYLREMKDLSQTAIAKILHLTQTGYGSYETGKTIPPLPTLIKLAQFYSVSLDYLVGFEAESDEILKLIHDFYALSATRQKSVLDYVQLQKNDMAYQAEQQRRAERKKQRLSATPTKELPQEE